MDLPLNVRHSLSCMARCSSSKVMISLQNLSRKIKGKTAHRVSHEECGGGGGIIFVIPVSSINH